MDLFISFSPEQERLSDGSVNTDQTPDSGLYLDQIQADWVQTNQWIHP